MMGPTHANAKAKAETVHTPTSLGRWSIANTQLPPVDSITTIHVYDFDNTLFKTPLPNPKLWNATTIGQLSSLGTFAGGGWWHNTRFLSAVGDGIEKEEARGWSGWWNEPIVKLVKLSMEQNDVLTVLLTGRSETGFDNLLKRMVKSKGLELDMIGLKPTVGPNNERFATTMEFKQTFLTAILETYKHATEMVMYEDRPRHVKQFQVFLDSYNTKLLGSRHQLKTDVIHVQETATNLDPVVEVAEVQQLINHHNDQLSNPSLDYTTPHLHNRFLLKKTVFFTAYMIRHADSRKLLGLIQIPSMPKSDLKSMATSILICPRPCPQALLEKVGGMGAKMSWRVIATAFYEGIWAARLQPTQSNATYHTENSTPLVILAMRKGARPFDASKIQNWKQLPADKKFHFETTVNEKVALRIEADGPEDNGTAIPNKPKGAGKRKHAADEEYPRHQHGPPFGDKSSRGQGGGGRGGRGGFRGGGNQSNKSHKNSSRGAGGRGGRGGRGGYGYRSLDDVEPKGAHANTGGYGFPAAVYDDEPLQPQRPMMGGGGANSNSQQQQQPPTQPASFNAPPFPQQPHQFGGGNWQPPTGPQGQGGQGPMNSNAGPSSYGTGNPDALGSYY